jgi:hypothetical protein
LEVPFPPARREIKEKDLLLGWRRPMLLHASLMIGFDLSEFGFLLRRQNLHNFGLDASVLDLKLDHGLGILRC